MRRLMLFICTMLAIMLISCEFDHLHYETSRCALVRIKIDWEARTHLTPNGVSAYVFDANGDKYSDVILSSDPNNVYLKLPPGDYSVVFHNNSISELKGVHLTGSSKLESFGIHADDATYDPTFDKLENKNFVDEPDDVASYTLRGIHVGANDIKYHYYKPDLEDYKQEVNMTYTIEPEHIVHVMRVIAYLDGTEFSSSKNPRAVIHGMSGGYFFGAECTSEEDVMEEFEGNISSSIVPLTRTAGVNGVIAVVDPETSDGFTDEELEGLGMTYVECNTFGMHMEELDDQKYHLYIRFFLYDGTYADYEFNITDYIRTEDLGTNNRHTVELILTPLPDGGGEPGDGSWGPGAGDASGESGVFDPTLDDWIGVDTDVPM